MKPFLSLRPRRGVALVTAMVAMAVLTVVLSVVTLQIVSHRRLVQQRQRQLQAEWLARAGIELAAARLLENPAGFSEDRTDLLPESRVHITIEKTTGETYSVTVEAQTGLEGPTVVVRTSQRQFRREDRAGTLRLMVPAKDEK